jgi:small subunit ribosomal protein S20
LVNPSAAKPVHPAVKSSAAEKAARQAVTRHKRNTSIRSQVKTDITRAEKLIFTGELDAAGKAVTAAVSALDKAAAKKVFHSNNAARRKSRLMKKLVQAKARPSTASKPEKPA